LPINTPTMGQVGIHPFWVTIFATAASVLIAVLTLVAQPHLDGIVARHASLTIHRRRGWRGGQRRGLSLGGSRLTCSKPRREDDMPTRLGTAVRAPARQPVRRRDPLFLGHTLPTVTPRPNRSLDFIPSFDYSILQLYILAPKSSP
jgi:hypothetical protein